MGVEADIRASWAPVIAAHRRAQEMARRLAREADTKESRESFAWWVVRAGEYADEAEAAMHAAVGLEDGSAQLTLDGVGA